MVKIVVFFAVFHFVRAKLERRLSDNLNVKMTSKVADAKKIINKDGDGHELKEPKLEAMLGEIVNAPVEAHELKFDKPAVQEVKLEKKDSEPTLDARYSAACQQYSARPNAKVLLKIRNNTLCTSGKIDVSDNFLGDHGVCALLQILPKYPVTHVILKKNGLRNSAVKVLSEVLKKHITVNSIDLSGNDISLLAATELQLLLRENKNITELILKNTRIDDASIKRIESLLESNKKK